MHHADACQHRVDAGGVREATRQRHGMHAWVGGYVCAAESLHAQNFNERRACSIEAVEGRESEGLASRGRQLFPCGSKVEVGRLDIVRYTQVQLFCLVLVLVSFWFRLATGGVDLLGGEAQRVAKRGHREW